jgi:D-3-phosphoglycerate dehydrogenase
LPHLGASTPESEENCARLAADEMIDFLENGNIKNSVNFPNCDMGKVKKTRITLTHENVPNMLGKISTKFARLNINIANMLNRSKGENAYTMVDIDGKLDESVVADFKNIREIKRVFVF